MTTAKTGATLDELLASLRKAEVRLRTEGDQLRYRAEAGALTAELRRQLPEQKSEILEFLKNAEGPEQELPSLQATPRSGNLPLSFAQQRLWFLHQVEPNSATYNIPIALRLTGALDIAALQRSLDEVLRRHESLRTRFEAVEGQPAQVIQPAASLEMPLVDLEGSPEPEREETARRLCAEEARRPFDLTRDVLLRTKLFRLGEADHILLLTMHHIASDGWSLGLLNRELGALYEAFVEGKPSPLPELPVQYADFAAWQREWLRGETLDKQVDYWRKQLEGAPALLELPTDRPRPAVQSYRGALISGELPKRLSAGLKELSRAEGATLFMTLLAAFQTLLHRYSGSDQIVVGSPIAGRQRPEVEQLIGFFVNTLVMRGDLSGDPSFRMLLARTRDAALGAYAHQDLPFERLVEELHPERNASHAPIFQVVFALQNAPGEEAPALPGLEVAPIPIDIGVSKFDLTLSVRERDGRLSAVVEYSTDLFDADTIRRMLEHYQTLLEGIVANPDGRLSDLPLLTEAERQQLLVEWNRTEVAYPKDRCLHELFEEQVERTPDAVAVVFEDEQLTYRQLNKRANQLARYLQKLGVGPDKLVAICMERSLEMVVGLLGILKAGGAYVPLDPEYPEENLSFMLRDAGASVLLTQKQSIRKLGLANSRIVYVDDDWKVFESESDDNLLTSVAPGSLLYAIYTSGSTGKPKGTGVYHRGFVNLLRWYIAECAIDARDCVLLFSSISFDATQKRIFGPLTCGGKLHLLSIEPYDPSVILDLIHRNQITLLNCTPSAFYPLIEPASAAIFNKIASLRCVLLGGEPISKERLRPWLESEFCHAEVVNTYGPTECTDIAASYRFNRSSLDTYDFVPLGRPIFNVQLVIVSKDLQPCPIGVPGEVCIAGIGVGAGYVNNSELTASKFIRNPFCELSGQKLYKTGDLARYLPDGTIEYLGRLDHQVKIRGFRIELGEIESVLAAHPAVREAVVLAREDVPGDKRLAAYLTVTEGEPPKDSELRALLRAKLPEYMIPPAFVVLDRLPLTPNGKVDRKALPRPDLQSSNPTEFAPPGTETEKALAGIWSEVLGVKQVGLHDNFFELGGHSLLATRVAWRATAELGVRLPLRTLFEHPTLADLAEQIDALLWAGDQKRAEAGALTAELPPLRTASRDGSLPLSFAQQRLWFLHQVEPNSATYNIPIALRLTGALDIAALQRSLDEVLRRHESLRTRFEAVEGQPAQVIQPAASLEMPLVDLEGSPEPEREETARRLCAEEARRPFDLTRDVLLRTKLFRLGEADHILLLTMHHIASDGWSLGLLNRELGALYEAFVEGKPSPLPELPVQYADFAAWQREWLRGETLDKQVDYWRKQLEGAPALLELPTDRPRPAAQSYRGALISGELPKRLSAGLKELSRAEGATLFMTLLAAFQTLLHRYSGSDQIVVGSPIAGRQRPEVEQLIGFFVNTLVMRGDLSGDPSFRMLLARTRDAALGAYAHQDLPFERLVEELHPERNASHAPIFQVVFALQNAPGEEAPALPGLEVAPIPIDIGVSKFDLTLSVRERDGRLSAVVEYSTDLFDADTIRRMLEHYQTLLEGIVANPDGRLSDLPLLTEAERQQLLVEWNRTEVAYPKDRCLHELFEEQVERTPDAVAVVFEDEQLTYRQLNKRANQLAHHLRKLGVEPDMLLGLLVERSPEMVVGMLGILKAGAAYLPLDPVYPKKRLAFMLDDAKPKVTLTQQHLLELLPANGAKAIAFDSQSEHFSNERSENPECIVQLDQLAYVIYTSGSTGSPKGTLVTHENVVRLFQATEAWYHFGPEDVWTLFHSHAFDFSVWEVWGALAYGGRLIVVPYFVTRSPDVFYELLRKESVTILNQTPSAFRQLILAEQASANCEDLALRLVIFGGEALEMQSLKPWFERHGDQHPQLVNMYGITETTVHVTYRPLAIADLKSGSVIGIPIPDLQVYILDKHRQPVPIGVVGELFVGGAGVARGYLNLPELTRERFIDNPFRDKPGERLYRSGDLARYLSNGDIEYVGRIDDQVKIRGFRIELGEIESVLAAHPAVREAVVLAREDVPGDKRLAAYLTVTEGEPPKDSELRDLLRAKLPEYMIPPAFVVLGRLPLTPNGKVDRKALPRPDLQSSNPTEFAPPVTETEKALADIWGKVLGISRVGLHDNFFELGGHSLMAARVASRATATLGVDLQLRTLFEYPTLAGLAEQTDALLRVEDQEEEPACDSAAALEEGIL